MSSVNHTQIQHFIRDGHVKIPNAFLREVTMEFERPLARHGLRCDQPYQRSAERYAKAFHRLNRRDGLDRGEFTIEAP